MLPLKKAARHEIIQRLVSQAISFDEVMRLYNIQCLLWPLGPELEGLVYLSKKGRYYIFINKNLTYERRQMVLFHELKHIIADMPRCSWFVGLNHERRGIEREADMLLAEITAVYSFW